jgi:hypothetical protein
MTDKEIKRSQELFGKTEELEAEIKRLQELADYRLKLLTKMPNQSGETMSVEAMRQAKQDVDWEAVAADQALTIAMLKQREWVGLTEEEIDDIQYSSDTAVEYTLSDEGNYGVDIDIFPEKFARAIEAKLKEKNT